MDMDKINIQEPGLEDGKKGMDYGLKALFARSKDMAEFYSLPARLFPGNVGCAGSKDDFMAGFDNERIQLLAMFFNTSGNVWDTTGACDKNFHDISTRERETGR
jgi:hypothetical protein